MNEFLSVLQGAGPFTAPLCAAMGFAIRYLLTALDKMELRALKAENDAMSLRDLRAKELSMSTEAMGEMGEATRERLRAHDERIDRLLSGKTGKGIET
jgi:hypothetical protein